MLNFKLVDINNKIENPIIASLLLTIVIVIIIIIYSEKYTFNSLKYIFIGTFISSFLIIWTNYNSLEKKYYEQIMDKNTKEIMTKVIPEVIL